MPSATPRPAVVYFHNDFGLTQLSVDNAQRFVDAGFVVLLPMLRSENGNPGRFELLYGEVDDARAAIAFAAARPEVDPRFVYAFGHSIGGGVAAMLSLYPDVPVRLTASVGGIYRASAFDAWASSPGSRHLIRFDRADRNEVTLRLLGPNVRDLVHPHIAYAGRADGHDLADANHVLALARPHRVAFEVMPVEGDHVTAVEPATRDFIARIRADAAREAPVPTGNRTPPSGRDRAPARRD